MRCIRCGTELQNGRGAYFWRLEFAAIGEDVKSPFEACEDLGECRRKIFRQLADMTAEEIENDVYQQIEAVLCRPCRTELGKFIAWFLMEDEK